MPEPRRFCPSRNHRSSTLHKQSFDPLEPEAGVARTLVDFDPRRASFAYVSAQHAPSTARMHPSPARSDVISNLPRARGCVSYFTPAMFLAKAAPLGALTKRKETTPQNRVTPRAVTRRG